METKDSVNTAITVGTTVNLPADKVWEFWTLPGHITKWNNASDDWHTPFAENDLNEGRKFLMRMEAKDGSYGFDFTGSYVKIIKNELIEYKLDDGRNVRISFNSDGSTTKISETFETESTNSPELQRSGWQAILDNFKKYAEENTKQ